MKYVSIIFLAVITCSCSTMNQGIALEEQKILDSEGSSYYNPNCKLSHNLPPNSPASQHPGEYLMDYSNWSQQKEKCHGFSD